KPGVSSGDAIRAVEDTAAKALPEGYQIAWSGQAFQEKRTGRASAIAFGLAAKNAILIVEFAQQGFLEGKSATEAALNAARLRFRPIVMTSLAFVLGVLPLMLSTGAGAGARRSMGTGVVGGMLAATFIATIFIPLFFTVVARRKKPRAPEAAAEHAPAE